MHGLPDQGVQQIRCNFTERLQNEAAFRQAGMRNYEVFFVNCPVAVEQKVKIYPAWSLMDRSDPLKIFILDPQQVGQQGASVKPC